MLILILIIQAPAFYAETVLSHMNGNQGENVIFI